MRFFALDTETNILNSGEGSIGKMEASPFWPENAIVIYGESRGEGIRWHDSPANNPPESLKLAASGKDVLLILFNAAFDLLYLMKTWPALFEKAQEHLYIWDVQQIEYLLSGQSELYPSLDGAAEKYGFPLKDDKIKQYWEQGIDTAMIPREELVPYLVSDVANTRGIFLKQYDLVNADPSLMALAKVKMDDILMTTMMTWYGMAFDLEEAQKHLNVLDAEAALLRAELEETGKAFFEPDYDWDVESPDDISLAMYGGFYTVRRDMPVLDEDGEQVYYKSGQKKGQPKTRKEDVQFETNGLNLPPHGPATARGKFSTSEEHLSKYKDVPFVTKLLRLREILKDTETYYRGYSALVFPDGKLHPTRNHCSTITGRLSCAAPNLENVSRDDD